jgi:hypothetical protein
VITILVSGSRDWGDRLSIVCALSRYIGQDVTVMHGAASRRDPLTGLQISADMIADEVARSLGFAVRPFPADWKRHPRHAGFLRNISMLDEDPDRVIAFWRNKSAGTAHTIAEARARYIPVELHEINDAEVAA